MCTLDIPQELLDVLYDPLLEIPPVTDEFIELNKETHLFSDSRIDLRIGLGHILKDEEYEKLRKKTLAWIKKSSEDWRLYNVRKARKEKITALFRSCTKIFSNLWSSN